MMTIAIVTGSGLGYSTDSVFMGLAQAAGMVITGLAMFGGAKYDEMVARKAESRGQNGNRENDIMERARSNVGRPEGSSERGVSGKGISYRKNAGYRKNMKNAEDMMNENRKRRAGAGVMSAKLFGAFVGGMSADFSNIEDIKGVGKGFSDVFSDKDFEGENKNYPYSDKYFMDMRKASLSILEKSWKDVIDNISGTNLGNSSGAEAVRQARINANEMAKKPNKVEFGNDE